MPKTELISVKDCRRDPHNKRPDLDPVNSAKDRAFIDSVSGLGVIQNIVVQRRSEAGGHYLHIIAGDRRFQAACHANKPRLEALVYAEGESVDLAAIKLAENVQRRDMSAWQTLQLIELERQLTAAETDGLTIEKLAERLGSSVGFSGGYIERCLRLYKALPAKFRELANNAPHATLPLTLTNLTEISRDTRPLRKWRAILQRANRAASQEGKEFIQIPPELDLALEGDSAGPTPDREPTRSDAAPLADSPKRRAKTPPPVKTERFKTTIKTAPIGKKDKEVEFQITVRMSREAYQQHLQEATSQGGTGSSLEAKLQLGLLKEICNETAEQIDETIFALISTREFNDLDQGSRPQTGTDS